MTRIRSTLGVLLLSALAVCAFGVSSASALTGHECKAAGKGTGTKYSDAKCSVVSGEGTFETEAIEAGVSKNVEGTVTPTTGGVELTTGENTAGEHLVLHSILGGIEVQITCTGFSTPEANATNNAGPPMTVTGTGKSRYTGCAIVASTKAAENCEVPATLETVTLKQTTEEDKVVYEPNAGAFFIKIPFTNKAGKTCPAAILGEKEFKGVAKGSVASPTSIEFTKTSGSALTLGGQTAFFTGVIHFRTAGTSGETGTIGLETP
jgi:hypothetical protein